jgi:hypothetical protein
LGGEFAATVTDPGTLDTHEFRWDFTSDGTWDTSWSASSAASHTYGAGGNYLAACQARDNHGAVGSDSATVVINQPNVPPVAHAVIAGTNADTTNLPGLNVSVTLDGSGSYDPDSKPSPLYFDWRDGVDNPLKPALVESTRHSAQATTLPLSKPGVYTFALVVFDGEYNSEAATLTINVPGWEGNVICDGFISRVPLWGVDVSVSNKSMHQLDSSRTDEGGEFLVDSGAGYQVAELKRRSESKNMAVVVDPIGTYTHDIYFLPNYFVYAGHVITGTPGAYAGIHGAALEVLIGNGMAVETDFMGSFGFGSVPETWPLDGEPYKVRLQKAGIKSQVLNLPLTLDRNSEMILAYASAGDISISGTVLSAEAGLPVSGVTLEFGNGWSALSASNGSYGPLSVPEGRYAVICSAPGFKKTIHYTGELAADTELDLTINGGEVSVYGEVHDDAGYVITDAFVTAVATYAVQVDVEGGQIVKASGAGYFDLPLPLGRRMVVVSAPGYEPVMLELELDGHSKQDILLIPEPGLAAFTTLLAGILLFARQRKEALASTS